MILIIYQSLLIDFFKLLNNGGQNNKSGLISVHTLSYFKEFCDPLGSFPRPLVENCCIIGFWAEFK